MLNIRTLILATALAALTACAAKETTPAENPAPVVPAPSSAPLVAKPAEVAPAAPAAVPEPPKKPKKQALGLPALPTLKDEVGMNPKQLKACKAIYEEYKAKLDEATAKIKVADDKKAANKEIAAPLRKEVLAKLREVCADDAQKAKFDQATAPAKKKPANP